MIARPRLEHENTHLKRALKQRYSFPNIIGKSERMLRMLDLVAQVAPSRATILITGETGTGKELIAKAIHANSPRADQMFVAVNSGSLPPDLLESTLFGHVKGAFTSAIHIEEGLLRSRQQGHHLLRRDRHHRPGDAGQAAARDPGEASSCRWARPTPIKVDVRILAATNADLTQLVEEGKFREDLYYRLNVINIALPPLRERKEDIPPLVEHFFTKYCRENEKFLDAERHSRSCSFEPEAMQVLMDHNWPGNVRELENVVERAVVLASEPSVPVDVLPDSSAAGRTASACNRGEGGPLPAGRLAVRDRRRFRAAQHHRAPGAVQLEPDRSRREPARPALDAESEDQAAGHQDPQKE